MCLPLYLARVGEILFEGDSWREAYTLIECLKLAYWMTAVPKWWPHGLSEKTDLSYCINISVFISGSSNLTYEKYVQMSCASLELRPLKRVLADIGYFWNFTTAPLNLVSEGLTLRTRPVGKSGRVQLRKCTGHPETTFVSDVNTFPRVPPLLLLESFEDGNRGRRMRLRNVFKGWLQVSHREYPSESERKEDSFPIGVFSSD